jgi:hypothetical protein
MIPAANTATDGLGIETATAAIAGTTDADEATTGSEHIADKTAERRWRRREFGANSVRMSESTANSDSSAPLTFSFAKYLITVAIESEASS